MVIKNVKLDWAFISRPDENGNFRVTFTVTPEQAKLIDEELAKACKENNKDLETAEWKGSKKVTEEGEITYSAKCAQTFKNKQGETIERSLPVYDKQAKRFEEVPNIANGALANVDVSVYYAKYKQKFGAMLGLRGIQLIQYEEYNGGNNFEPIEETSTDAFDGHPSDGSLFA